MSAQCAATAWLERNFTIHIGRNQYKYLDTLVQIWDAPPDVTFLRFLGQVMSAMLG